VVAVLGGLCAVAHAQYAYQYDPTDFATSVVQYIPGVGVGVDYLSGLPFTDAATALGRPTVDSTGDGWNIPADDAVPVVSVYGPFRSFEVVTVGLGGRLTVRFEDPVLNEARNPYGVDLVIYGNSWSTLPEGVYWTNGDPANATIAPEYGFIEPGTVSVSQDGQTWYTFDNLHGPHADPEGPYAGTDGPYADVFAPTLGRVYDPQHPDPALGAWNLWWGHATDPTWPVDPRLKWGDLFGESVAWAAELYEESAGGTALDLEWLEVPGLDWIRYVRIEGGTGGGTPEVDAVADVFPHLGDFDRDGDVDLADFAGFQNCFTGPGQPRTLRTCFPADFDGNLVAGDLDVDLDDFAWFAEYLTGPVSVD